MKKAILLLLPVFLNACTHNKEMMAADSQPEMHSDAHKDPNSLVRLAESLKQGANYETAANMYQQALTLDPDMHSARIGYSECMRFTGRNEAALQALKTTPEDARNAYWYKELGSVETAAQNPNACISAYKRVLSEFPKDVDSLNGVAVCYDLIGQHETAQNWYQQAISVDMANTRLKSNYALSLALSKRPAEAIEILKPIVESADATSRDRHNLAVAYGLKGDLETASQYFAADMDQTGIRTNLAFIHKLAESQNLGTAKMPAQSFESNLSSSAPIASKAPIEIKEIKDTPLDKEDVVLVPAKNEVVKKKKTISTKKVPKKASKLSSVEKKNKG